MSIETKHTPGPWSVDPNDCEQINGADGMSVALLRRAHRTEEEGEANAALIVRAVNLHRDAIDLLENIREELREDVDCNHEGTGPNKAASMVVSIDELLRRVGR